MNTNKLDFIKHLSQPFYFEGSEIGILLTHGFTASPSEMLPLGQFLHKYGYTVHGVRLAGHGTNVNDLPKHSYMDWFESVEKGYFLLQDKCETIIPMGISMGALLTLMLVDKYQKMTIFPKLVLIAPAFELKSRTIKLVPFISPFMKFIYKGDTVLEYYKEKNLFAYYHYPTKSLSDLLRLQRYFSKTIRNLDVKSLIIYGELDNTISKQAISKTIDSKFINPKRVECVSYPESGHNFTTDPDAIDAFTKIKEFLQRK